MPSGTPLPDAAALEQAVQQYQAELLRYASGILGNRADAEVALNPTFATAAAALSAGWPYCLMQTPLIRKEVPDEIRSSR